MWYVKLVSPLERHLASSRSSISFDFKIADDEKALKRMRELSSKLLRRAAKRLAV
jgi:hypothetical protein